MELYFVCMFDSLTHNKFILPGSLMIVTLGIGNSLKPGISSSEKLIVMCIFAYSKQFISFDRNSP